MKTKMIQTTAGIFLPSFQKSAQRQQINIGDFDLVSVDCWFMKLVYFIQNLPIHQNIFSVHITYESLLFNASKNNFNKTFEFVLLCLSFRPWAGSHVKQFFCWINCFIFSSWDSDYIGSSESDDDGKQLNTIDTQHKQYNLNSLDFRNFKSENYVKIFPWLYYQSVEKGYKCRTCELLPSVGSGG